MRIPLLIELLCLMALVAVAEPVYAQSYGGERITSFNDDVVVRPDATIDVTETISVIAAGSQIKFGIYRDFPTRYYDKSGQEVDVGFHIVGASRDNQPVSYELQSISNGQRVFLGSNRLMLVPGPHTYVLHYQTDHQLGYFEKYDELYWNATGNGWRFPIDRVTATVTMPPKATLVQYAAYTGAQGAQGRDYQVSQMSDGSIRFVTTRTLNPQEGLTISVAWPKGLVAQLAPIHPMSTSLKVKIGCGLYGLLIAYYIIVWFLYGRSPRKGTIIPLFAPPASLSPGEVNYLYKKAGGADNTAFSASLVNMAVKGYLKIIDNMGIKLQKSSTPASVLSSEEQIIAKHTVDLAPEFKLNRMHNAVMLQTLAAYDVDLYEKYGKTYYNYNTRYLWFGTLLGLLIAIPTFIVFKVPLPVALVLGASLLLITHIVFSKLLQTPTIAGRKLIDQIEGFKMYLGTAEKNRLNMFTPPDITPEIFEKFLPYAMALGVQNKWGQQFEAAVARGAFRDYAPAWYVGNAWNINNISGFTSSFAGEFSQTVQASVEPPGSISGSGGGGSSGSGGGGGGGGGF